MKFLNELNKRKRGEVTFLLGILAVLTWLTAKVAWHLLSPDPSLDGIDLTREWALPPFLVLPWIGLAGFYRMYRGHRERHAHPERSIHASIRALLDENRLQRERYKTVGWLHAAMLLLIPLIVLQLREAGKAGDEILVPAFVLLPALLLAIFLAMRRHERRVLRPRQRELEALLATYGEE